MLRAHRRLVLVSLAVSALVGGACSGDKVGASPDAQDTSAPPADVADAVDTGEDPGPVDTSQPPDTLEPTARVVLLHTGNELGAIAGVPAEGGGVISGGAMLGGAALVQAAWKRSEPAERIVLSSGDSFLGSAISSWFTGAPAIEVMNAMGYDMMTLGNHEFNLGRAQLRAWRAAANFPFIAANLRDTVSADPLVDASWASFVIDGVQVGVIGLVHQRISGLAPPQHVAGMVVDDPLEVVAAVLPVVRAAGAEVVVVLGHLDYETLVAIALAFGDEVAVVLGGQAAGPHVERFGGALVVLSGSLWQSYGRVELTVDRASGEVTASTAEVIDVNAVVPALSPDRPLATLVDGWSEQIEAALGETIGYLTATVAQGSWGQANWMTDAWRWSFPEADFAIQIIGGLRAPLGAGEITRRDVVDVMPFDNNIYQVTLTGAEVIGQLDAGLDACGTCRIAVSGLRYEPGPAGLVVVDDAGAPLDLDGAYEVLLNDFMYFGGAGFTAHTLGYEPRDTGLNYRDPAMAWTEAQATTAAAPLDALIDFAPRDQSP